MRRVRADGYRREVTGMVPDRHAWTLAELRPLPPKYGFPVKLRMPIKLGYKNPKQITYSQPKWTGTWACWASTVWPSSMLATCTA
jgi:hypothetical protein